MNIFRVIMFTLQILMLFPLLGLAISKENIYADTSMPDHPFRVIRFGMCILLVFVFDCI